MVFPQGNIEEQETRFLTINGSVNNVKERDPYIYAVFVDGHTRGLDSAKIIDNKYHFSVKTEVPTLVTLYAQNPNANSIQDKNMLILLLEPAVINICSTDSFSNAIVSGSKANEEFISLEQKREPYSKEWSSLYAIYQKKDSATDKNATAELKKRMDSILNALGKMYYSYAKSNPSSSAAAYALEHYVSQWKNRPAEEEIEDATNLFKQLPEAQKTSYFGRRIKKKLDSYHITVGMSAPFFVQYDTSGRQVALSSFKRKYVLLDFWASWCAPCRKENANLVKVYSQYKNKGLIIFSISLDRREDKNKWKEAIRHDQLTWPQASDLNGWDNAAAKAYKVTGIPQNFLIDPSGKIIEIGLFGERLQEFLRTVLSN